LSSIAENALKAAKILEASGIAESRREANSLLAFTLGKDKTFLVAHSEYELSGEEERRFQEILQRRAKREPLQYITGRQEFYGLDFEVTPDVLIPRPETELIVENAIEILRNNQNGFFCEVGVGSGCISVAILHEIKQARAVGLDISKEALEVARKNAVRHLVLEQLELKVSDVFTELKDEKFNLIVSNPPYIPSEDIAGLQPEVRGFEPFAALTDNRNGLSIIEKIINDSPRFLKTGGFLLMEIGYNQAREVRDFFSIDSKWQKVEILPDLQKIPRMVKAKFQENL
jgi:release factor glutamine methyltransferase